MYFLVTAGPTREHIDSVRFLSNPSSGKVGYAIARAAAARGHRVLLISGPTYLRPPEGVVTSLVGSAREMFDASKHAHPGCDCLVMAAAVCDYTPAEPVTGKIKKTRENLTVEFVRTPDILSSLGKEKAGRIHVGFALEVENALENARAKLLSKNLDFIVLNDPRTFGVDTMTATIVDKGGVIAELKNVPKEKVAEVIIERAEKIHSSRAKREDCENPGGP